MPHDRPRHAVAYLRKLQALWPAIGLVGPRQCGKTTLCSRQLEISRQITLDDEDVLDDVLRSAKVFVSRLEPPVVIDEVQKAPALFDALKARIDRQRRPGSFFLTGSSQFSARAGIRESLTGRIGVLQLYPLTQAELYRKPLMAPRPLQKSPSRFSLAEFGQGLERGGMPVPCFLRDESARQLYWNGWLDTTIHRDMARLFKRGYDPRLALRILRKLAEASANGEYFTGDQMAGVQSRKLNTYLTAFEEIFVLRRIPCHELGVGRDHWVVFDSGLLNALLGGERSEGGTLSLCRTLLFQEIAANLEYSGQRWLAQYYKSSRGRPVDFIWDGIPLKVVTSSRLSAIGWEERALAGAMKKLGAKQGLLVAPVDRADIPKSGIGVVPWHYWS